MKKIVSLVLVLAICLSLCACGKSDTCPYDCDQCAEYEKKTQNTEIANTSHADVVSEEAEQNENVIEFETPIVVAEDENLRVELVQFYQDYYLCKEGYQPRKVEVSAEGASLETLVVFKFYNKCNHELAIRLNDVYLGDNGASGYHEDGSGYLEPAAEKSVLGRFLIRSGEHKALNSVEELYSLDGEFYVYHKYEDGVLREQYEFQFSIPNGMKSGSVSANSEAAPLEQASSDERVEEVIELIDEIVLEDIVVTDTVKEAINGIYTKYNALTDEEREKVSNYETLNKAKDTYNEMWVKSLVKIEKIWFKHNAYTNEIELNIDWVNKSPKTIKYIKFDVAVTNSVGDYIMWNGYDFNRYTLTGPFETNHRATERWSTMRYRAADEVGWPVVNQIYIEYMDGSAATITEDNVRFALPQ